MTGRSEAYHRVRNFTLFFTRCAFSQHSRCMLDVDDHQFHSALHYMLYEKASECSLEDLYLHYLSFKIYKKYHVHTHTQPRSEISSPTLDRYWFTRNTSAIKYDLTKLITAASCHFENCFFLQYLGMD